MAAASAASSSESGEQQQRLQQHSLLKIPLLARVARFACNTAPSVFRFRMVHSVWEETLLDFKMHEPLFARLASADVPGRPDAVYSQFWLDAAALLPPPQRVDPATLLPVPAPSPYQSRASQLADPTLLAGLEQAIRHENEVVVPSEYIPACEAECLHVMDEEDRRRLAEEECREFYPAARRECAGVAPQRRLQQLGQLHIVFRGSATPTEKILQRFFFTEQERLEDDVQEYERTPEGACDRHAYPRAVIKTEYGAFVVQLLASKAHGFSGSDTSIDFTMLPTCIGLLVLEEVPLSHLTLCLEQVSCRKSLVMLSLHSCSIHCDMRGLGVKEAFTCMPQIQYLFLGRNNLWNSVRERCTEAGSSGGDDDAPAAAAAAADASSTTAAALADREVFYLRDLPKQVKSFMLFNQCTDSDEKRTSDRELLGTISLEGCSDERLAFLEICATGTGLRLDEASKSLANKMKRCSLENHQNLL